MNILSRNFLQAIVFAGKSRFSFVLCLGIMAFTCFFSADAFAHSKSQHQEVKKYIQGGAPAGGNGSENHPYNSLAQAEAGNWDVLVVLPSPTVISGGIALKNGQKIKGKDRNACFLASYDASVHNGDVIVAHGNNSISGITITTAYRCAIEALNAKNLSVKNCSINNSNPSGAVFPYDYGNFSANPSQAVWFAISFFGGPTVSTGIQPYNTISGKFRIHDSSFNGNAGGIIVGSGDSTSLSFVPQTYKRGYEIFNCQFTNTSVSEALVAYPSGGGDIYGSITNCSFEQGAGAGIVFSTIRANNPNFPGRGNYQLGKNIVRDCTFKNLVAWGVLAEFFGNLTGGSAKVIVKNNKFHDVGLFGNVPPAVIEFGAASIQFEIGRTATGKAIDGVVKDNLITDSTGLVPGIAAYFLGGDEKLIADIQRNTIKGTTTTFDILFLNLGGAQQANGDFTVANNKFVNNDSVIVVATTQDSPFTDLKVKVENNCFKNTGARNSPPLQEPPFNNGSYYGAAVIFGGANNTALQIIGENGSDLGNAVLDLGGGSLGSQGHNSFINTTGADTWVESGLFLSARKNWFGGNAPIDAGVGGTVDFDPILRKNPHNCNKRNGNCD